MGRVNEDGGVTFGVPKGEIKDAYFDLILKQMYHLGLQISNTDSGSRSGIPNMVNYIISHIPSQPRRDELRQKIKEELIERIGDNKDQGKKQEITIEVYIEHMGNIAEYLEKFMGIEKENRLGIIGSPNDK